MGKKKVHRVSLLVWSKRPFRELGVVYALKDCILNLVVTVTLCSASLPIEYVPYGNDILSNPPTLLPSGLLLPTSCHGRVCAVL